MQTVKRLKSVRNKTSNSYDELHPNRATSYFEMHSGRLAVREDVLLYFHLSEHPLSQLLDNQCDWKFYIKVVGNQDVKMVYLDSVPRALREKFKLPSPKAYSSSETADQENTAKMQKAAVGAIKFLIHYYYSEHLRDERNEGSLKFDRFISEGFDIDSARQLVRTYHVLRVLISLHTQEKVKINIIYLAFQELIREHSDSLLYDFSIKFDSLRSFYDKMHRAQHREIEELVYHGLRGRPSNHRAISSTTQNLVVEFLKHFNHLSDMQVCHHVNAVIIALPKKFNNGKTISRTAVNEIKNSSEFRNIIKAARHGPKWVRENLVPDVNRVPTSFVLDRVEVDFTKLHVAIKGTKGQPVKRYVCVLKDVKSGLILGATVGESENFNLFQSTLSEALIWTRRKLPAELVFDRSSITDSKEFERIKKFMEMLGTKVTLCHSPTGKGSVESHFATMLKSYLPEYVGTLGGNIATTSKHRPPHEICLLLQKADYMPGEEHWTETIREMHRKHNNNHFPGDVISRITYYREAEKPHAINLSEKYIAYISWYKTQRIFKQQTFTIVYGRKTFKFAKKLSDVASSKSETKFVLERTGDCFDVYFNPQHPELIHVFELDSLTYIGKFPMSEWFYGNKIDHTIDPQRADDLYAMLRERSKFTKNVRQFIKDISKAVKESLGVDLHRFMKEREANTRLEDNDLLDQVFNIMKENSPENHMEIDPFSGALQGITKKKSKKASIVSPKLATK